MQFLKYSIKCIILFILFNTGKSAFNARIHLPLQYHKDIRYAEAVRGVRKMLRKKNTFDVFLQVD